jgi:uncharacterized membrane protein
MKNSSYYSFETASLKFILCWIVVFLVRLVPFRPPNFEPMLATMMPFSKRFGPLGSFLFGFLGIVLFDSITSGIGMWTVITSISYGALGVGSYYFFKDKKATKRNFLTFGIIGTVLYDVFTGLTIGPLFFEQPFMVALIGQIPFTLMHLAGTVTFSLVLSPLLYRFIMKNEYLTFSLVPERILARSRTY